MVLPWRLGWSSTDMMMWRGMNLKSLSSLLERIDRRQPRAGTATASAQAPQHRKDPPSAKAPREKDDRRV
jgi:hypothetical protein